MDPEERMKGILRFDAGGESLGDVRVRVRKHLQAHGEAPADWELVATELVTNAVEASRNGGVAVELTVSDDHVEVQVTDSGPGHDLAAQLDPPGPETGRGRGLPIVDALVDELWTETGSTGSTTAARRPRTAGADVAVIGLGSAGEAASRTLADAGLRVIGFEPALIGGECPFVACMPSKSMLYDSHRARGTDDPAGRWDAAVARRNEIVDHRDDAEHADSLTDAGVDIVRDSATIVAPRLVEAGGRRWQVDHVVVATGSSPRIPPIDGLEEDRVWTAFDALRAEERPERVLLLGAGPVGCELADVFAGFGSSVILVDDSARLLGDHDAEVADRFAESIRDRGIDLRLGVAASAFEHGTDGTIVRLDDESELEVDRVIVATGQLPRLESIGLESIGLSSEAVPEVGDDRSAADHPWLWLIGDLNGLNPWTHGANRDAAIASASILGSPWSKTTAAMPRATFTDPPAAHVGTAATADNGHLRGVGKWSDVARTSTDELEDGVIVVAVDASTGAVVGCSAIGPSADELISTATSLVHFEIAIDDAVRQVFPFPTVSQTLEVALEDAHRKWRRRQAE